MEHGNAIPGKTRGTLTLDVRKDDWSLRISYGLDLGGAALLLSLPSGLFVAHDREMSRAGACSEPTAATDADFLVDMWGFTRVAGCELAEIADVDLLSVGVSERGVSVSLADCPWLLADVEAELPAEWLTAEGETSCVVGLCFDADLRTEGAEDLFWSQLEDGQAVLGQVNVILQR